MPRISPLSTGSGRNSKNGGTPRRTAPLKCADWLSCRAISSGERQFRRRDDGGASRRRSSSHTARSIGRHIDGYPCIRREFRRHRGPAQPPLAPASPLCEPPRETYLCCSGRIGSRQDAVLPQRGTDRDFGLLSAPGGEKRGAARIPDFFVVRCLRNFPGDETPDEADAGVNEIPNSSSGTTLKTIA